MKKNVQIIMYLLVFFSFFSLTYFLLPKILGISSLKDIEENNETPHEDLIEAESSYNFALLGFGGEGHDGGYLTDVIMIIKIDDAKKKASFISIPRDLWVEIPIRSDKSANFKINSAYAIGRDDTKYPLKEPQYKGESGAGILTKEVISKVTGVQIEGYIAVNFENFKKIVDTLGGVDVQVPVTFDDNFYPIKGRENDICGKSASEIAELHQKYSDTALHHQFECRYEHIHYEKGPAKLNGEEALKFVRSRASTQHGGDFARSQRQQAVLVGFKDKLISLYSVKKIDQLYEDFKGFIATDLDLKSAKKVLEVYGSPKDYKLSFVSLTTENVLVATKSSDGQFILIPKEGESVWSGVQKFIHDSTN